MSDIAYGSGNDPNLPQVNLPSLSPDQQQRPQITINRIPQPQDQTGGWAAFTPATAPQQQAAAPDTQTGGWASFTPKDQTPAAEVGAGEAGLRGAAHGLTFGLYPAMAGAVSGAKAALSGEGDFSTAYNNTRQQEEDAYQESSKQHPYISAAGDVAGSLPSLFVPGIGLGKAAMTTAETLPRIFQAIKSGGIVGGLMGAGDQTSQGGDVGDIATGAAGGMATGAALGGVLGSGVEGASKVAQRVGSIVRGNRDPGAEAASLVVGALKGDQKQVMKVAGDAPALNAAQSAGTDLRLADFGGANTKALLRASTNVSPSARDVVHETVTPRFQQQSDRVSRLIRKSVKPGPAATEPLRSRIAGTLRSSVGLTRSSAEDVIALHEAARRANRPAYTRAYNAGDRQIWSPELERLTSAPSIHQALRSAVTKWRDWQVHDGFGAANAPVMVKNGILNLGNGTGLPVFPNIQLWDYAARHIADRAEKARRSGATHEATRLGGLERKLKIELDRMVPEYGEARAGAARFFGAEDAHDAGRVFARSANADIGGARQATLAMSDPERELFRRGYASETSDILDRAGDEAHLLKSALLSSPAARQKNVLALGPQTAREIEEVLARARVFENFGSSENATEAGRYFVSGGIDNREAAKFLAQMSKDERERFGSAFADELANKIERIGDNRSVINSIFVNNGPARQRVLLALGQEDAGRLESLLRVEGIVDRTRKALGNSTTIQQGHDAGKFAGSLAAIEGLKGAFNPIYLVAIPLIWGGRKAAKEADERVFTHVAELLMSQDPAVLSRGLQIAAKNPSVRTALRYASDLSAHELISLLGASGVASGALTAGKYLKGAAQEAPTHAPHDQYDDQGQQVSP